MKDYVHNLDNDGWASETILYKIMDSHFIKELINTKVEILEDNTEDIEELDVDWTYIEGQVEKTWNKSELELLNKINELIRAYNKIRKEKE